MTSTFQDAIIRANLSAMLGRVSFGKTLEKPCCADCAHGAPKCGGAKFGAVVAAPPPPTVQLPISIADIQTYAGYVDSRVKAFDQAWSDWHDPLKWDNNGNGSCTPAQIQQINAQLAAGTLTTQQAAAQCHPDYMNQLALANAWSTNSVTGDGVGWEGWPAWSQTFHDYANQIQAGGALSWIKFVLEGPVIPELFGDYPTLQSKHTELIRFAKAANDAGLQNVPDPGKIPEPPSILPNTNLLPTNDIVSIVEIGVIGLLGIYAFTMFSSRKTTAR